MLEYITRDFSETLSLLINDAAGHMIHKIAEDPRRREAIREDFDKYVLKTVQEQTSRYATHMISAGYPINTEIIEKMKNKILARITAETDTLIEKISNHEK